MIATKILNVASAGQKTRAVSYRPLLPLPAAAHVLRELQPEA
jgi:hypothetical protein